MALFLTPTRRMRLEQVGRGEITYQAGQAWDNTTGFVVTAAMRELARAGWVVREQVAQWKEEYRLTEAGAAVLAAAAGTPVEAVGDGGS